MAQVGHHALHRVDRTLRFDQHPRLLSLRLTQLEVPQLLLAQRDVRLQRLVTLRHLGLLLQFFQICAEFAQDVLDPGQVFAGVGQPVLGLATPLLVLGNTGGLFQEKPQLLGLGLDDPADGALPDDGVSARAQPGSEEDILDIAPAHRLVVDVIAAGTVARQDAFDGDFSELAPLASRAVVSVLEHQLHAGAARRLAAGGSVENHVLHRLAAQLAGAAFAQHPAYRVHDVGLTAAVGAHDAHQLAGQHEIGRLREGLEARQLDRIQAHERLLPGCCRGRRRAQKARCARPAASVE